MPWDPEIRSMSVAQLTWCSHMIAEDELDTYNKNISLLDYIAWFINPEAMSKKTEADHNSVSVPEEDMEKILKMNFGK